MATDGTVEIFKAGIKKEINEVKSGLQDVLSKILEINKANRVSSKPLNVKGINGLRTQTEANAKAVKNLNSQLSTADRLNKKLLNSEKALEDARSKTNKQIIKNRLEVQKLNKRAKESAILSSKLSTEYEKQAVKLTRLRRKYKDVALTEGEASKNARRLRNQIIKLDASLKRVDGHVGQFQRNVGNYSKGMMSAKRAVTSMLGAMGAVGGAYLFVSVMRDAFKRVRDFDKSMQNLSGIMRVTRNDIKDLEIDIINVASVSVKTSREVAGLAESLATLGESKESIKKLLKPSVDLGIALETTGENAGEFLVQMLNAFGETSDKAGEYADVIATIRTSTVLDFQKMRDSFQYLAPISRILNKDLAYTGAVIGILAKSSIKAEQAGRLLGSAQQKLAKDGKTLSDALNIINDAKSRGIKEVKLLKIATELFGKQAAKVGIVLANNSDKLEENAQKIRDNGGALDDLVNQQLESLDSKLKILDSTWEKFILNIENGSGGMSSFFKSTIDLATTFLNKLNDINTVSKGYFSFTKGVWRTFIFGQGEEVKGEAELVRYNEQRKILLKKIGDIKIAEAKANNILISQAQIQDNYQHIKNKQIEKELQLYDDLKNKKELINKLLYLKKNLKKINLEKLSIKELIDLYKKLTTIKVNKSKKDENKTSLESAKLREGSIAYLEQIISLNEKKIKNSPYAGERQLLMLENEQIREQIDLIKERDRLAITKKKTIDQAPTDYLDPQEEIDLLKQGIKDYAETLGFDGEKALQDFIDKHGLAFDKFKEYYDELNEKAKQSAEIRKEIESQLKDETINFINSLWDNKISKIDDEIQANDDKYSLLLAQVQNDEVQRALIEEESEKKRQALEKKKRKEQRKQAIFNKAIQVGEIIGNTASYIIKLGAQLGIAAPPFQIAAGAIGALQLAAVLAQPIPKYAKGTDYHKGGLAVVGDGGKREVAVTPSGDIMITPNKSTLVDLPKGTQIYPDFNKYSIEQTDFSDMLKNASMIASVTMNDKKMQNYIDAQRVFDKQLLEEMQKNTKAVKESKSRLTLNVPKVDFSDFNYKNYYES